MLISASGRDAAPGPRPWSSRSSSILLFMMLFGIFEYGRFLFMYHLTNNAARDAARFAVVHTGGATMAGDPATITRRPSDRCSTPAR